MKIRPKEDSLDLSLVIPALHEAPNLRLLLPSLAETLPEVTDSWEVIVVDGKGEDESPDVVQSMGDRFRYVEEPQRGYGHAILRGMSEARGRYVITMDADLSHPAEFIRRLWEARDRGSVVIASRYVPGGQANQPAVRLALSKVLNRFFRSGLSLPIQDMSSGFRLYRKAIFRNMDLEHTNFAILVEILLKTFQAGHAIAEVPFTYQPRKEGVSNAQVWKFGQEYLRLFRRMWALRNSIEFPDYDWRAHDSRIWLQRYWQRRRHALVTQLVPQGAWICDVGCGSSRILESLPGCIGVDLRFNKLVFMRRVSTRLLQGDGMRLPFRDGEFNCVVSSQVIEHIPEEGGRLLDELTRILEPGGVLVIGTPDYGRWQWRYIEWAYKKCAPGAYGDEHVTQYTRESLEEALKERGYDIEDVVYVCQAEMIIRARRRKAPVEAAAQP